MKLRNITVVLLVFVLVILGCSSDDDSDFVPVEERDRNEQQIEDEAKILSYFETHYFNYDELQTLGENAKLGDISIDSLNTSGVPSGSKLFIDELNETNGLLQSFTTTYLEADYTYYILKLNQGEGDTPYFTDDIKVSYEGTSIQSQTVFDSTNPNIPLNFNLLNTIRAWQVVMPFFSASPDGDFSITSGVVDYNNYGLGVMFVPSGLAYFSGVQTGSSYDNLIFKFELLQTVIIDHDGDGIPSYLEDLNNDLSTLDEDTDEDLIVNYVDPDDDGDGVLTLNELERTEYIVDTNVGDSEPVLEANEFELSRNEVSGIITIITGKIVDLNNNNIPDYLDVDATDDLSIDN